MTRILAIALIAAGALAAPALAGGHLKSEKIEKINAMLESMRCEMDEDDIEFEEDGSFDLDDVICGGGQFDFKMNEDFHVTGARGE